MKKAREIILNVSQEKLLKHHEKYKDIDTVLLEDLEEQEPISTSRDFPPTLTTVYVGVHEGLIPRKARHRKTNTPVIDYYQDKSSS